MEERHDHNNSAGVIMCSLSPGYRGCKDEDSKFLVYYSHPLSLLT